MRKRLDATKSIDEITAKARAIKEGRLVSIKYSEIEDLKRRSSAASIALFRLARLCADIELTCLANEEGAALYARLTAMKDTKLNMQSLNKDLEADAFGSNSERTLKSIDLPSTDSKHGQTRKSRKK
jgi:HPt (histidine-containing phosphotransfer) domain-containing protein